MSDWIDTSSICVLFASVSLYHFTIQIRFASLRFGIWYRTQLTHHDGRTNTGRIAQ
jgi:hypothetical protein